MPKKARIILEITYELPVETGYSTADGGVTHDPDEMLDEDMKQITSIGFGEFIEFVEPVIKAISFEVVD